MKKQYLISLLGFAAISLSFGSGFSSNASFSTSSSDKTSSQVNSNLNEEELATIEQYSISDEYFGWTIEQIEMGNKSSAAVVNDGTGDNGDHLYTWGDNTYGQLGIPVEDNSINQYNSPQEVTGLPAGNIEQIEMGDEFSGAIIDGYLYTWGINSYGQLGYGPAGFFAPFEPEYNDEPKLVPDDPVTGGPDCEFKNGDVEQISMGENLTIAIVNKKNSEEDYLYTWGSNEYGQLGQKSATSPENWYYTPYQVVGIPDGDIKEVSAGFFFGSAIVNNNGTDELYTWGSNIYGKLGIGEYSNSNSFNNNPQIATGLPPGDIEQVSLGINHGGVVIENSLYTWGDNRDYQLGSNSADYYSAPQKVTELPDGNIEEISMSGNVSSAIVDGELYTWGDAKEYQLGIEETTEDQYIPQHIFIPTEEDHKSVSTVSIGINHSAAVADNKLYTWGTNDRGQLGLGSSSAGFFTPEYVENDMPYLIDIWSEPQITEPGDRTIEIKYGFKTNIIDTDKEFSVETHVKGKDSTINSTSIPIYGGNNYTGSEFITTTDENPYGDFTYTMNLNYTNRKGVQDNYLLVSDGNFNLTPKIQAPEFEYVDEVVVISSTKASVDYGLIPDATDSAGNFLTLKKVSWIGKVESEDEQVLDTDDTGALTGQLQFDEFDAEQTYENTKLVAEYEDSNGTSFSATASVSSFTMFFESTPTIVVSGEAYNISSKKASVNYEINELGIGSDGEKVKIEKVRWMNGDKQLDVSRKSDLSGTLTTNKLDPNHNYYNTRIEVDVSGENACPVDSAKVPLFKTDPGDEPTIVEESGTVEVLSSTSATVHYNIDLGLDIDGEPVEVTKVTWLNEGIDLVSTTSTAENGELTYNNFDYNQEYQNTTIEVEVSDGSTVEPATVQGFTTNPAICVWPTVKASNFSKDQTTASIDYEIYQGSNEWAKPYEITSILWVEADGITPFYDSEPVDNPNDNSNGRLNISGLTPGSPHPESKILVKFEGTNDINTTVSSFNTDDAETISPTIIVDESVNTPSDKREANIGYIIDPGSDTTLNDYEITKILWVEADGKTPFYDSEPVDNPNDNLEGNLKISGLKSETTYAKSQILVEFKGANSETDSILGEVPGFETPKYETIEPTINSKIVDEQLTSTSAKFSYNATAGSDADGVNFNLTKITIEDSNGTQLAIKENGGEPMYLDGFITIKDKLEPEVTYDDLEMVATFVDQTGEEIEPPITDLIDPFTTPASSADGLFGIYMIVGIIIGAAIFVVIIFGILGYLWNRKAMKIS